MNALYPAPGAFPPPYPPPVVVPGDAYEWGAALSGGGGRGGSEEDELFRPGGGGKDMMNGEFQAEKGTVWIGVKRTFAAAATETYLQGLTDAAVSRQTSRLKKVSILDMTAT